MESSRKYRIYENLLYLILWGLLFIIPIVSFFLKTSADSNFVFQWKDIYHIWLEILPFLLLFLIHNYFIAPLLIDKKKRVLYIVFVLILLFGFGAYQLTLGRQFKPEGPMPGMMERPLHESNPMMNNPEDVDFEGREMLPPKMMDKPRPPMGRPGMIPRPPILMDNISVIKLFIAVLLIGTNLGMKAFFRGKRDEEVVAKLEEQNLKYQLKYLKYQVNPHFFMNTLNNIHALVDINPEQAKSTIVELSKLMRYVLYEADKKFISLQREIDFIDHYIALMRIRYTEMVRITTNMPQEAGNVEIPPLIFIMFVENAFKHGVSYQKDSFIEISIQLENDRILFRCKNSKHSSDLVEGEGGLGLVNAKKRLDLIYGDDYCLQIYNEPLTFEVSLDLPAYMNSRLV